MDKVNYKLLEANLIVESVSQTTSGTI